jgi:hypothetical protein
MITGPLLIDQDVVFGEIAVHDAGAEHADHLPDEDRVELPGEVVGQHDVVEPWRRFAVGVGQQFHQQHAGVEIVRCRHAHAGRSEAVERVDLGMLPGGFLFLAAVARTFFHRPRLPGVAGLAPFGVGDRLAEAALLGFLVDLGAAQVVAALDNIDHCLLAAHQLADHLVDQAVGDQGQESARGFHGDSPFCCSRLRCISAKKRS